MPAFHRAGLSAAHRLTSAALYGVGITSVLGHGAVRTGPKTFRYLFAPGPISTDPLSPDEGPKPSAILCPNMRGANSAPVSHRLRSAVSRRTSDTAPSVASGGYPSEGYRLPTSL